jgi:hypothetical protein
MQFGRKESKSNERKADSKSPAVKKTEASKGLGIMAMPTKKENLFGEEEMKAGDQSAPKKSSK